MIQSKIASEYSWTSIRDPGANNPGGADSRALSNSLTSKTVHLMQVIILAENSLDIFRT